MAISIASGVTSRTVRLDLTRKLSDINEEFVIPEVRAELQKEVLDENLFQMAADNDPTFVEIDRTRRIALTESDTRVLESAARQDALVFRDVDSRISFFYTDASVLVDATRYAWNALDALMRKLKGQSWESVYLWVNDPDRGGRKFENLPEALSYIEKAVSAQTTVHILGPLTEYRRHVIYSHNGPGGASRQAVKSTKLSSAYTRKGKAIDRYKFVRSGTKIKERRKGGTVLTQGKRGGLKVYTAKAVHELVQSRVRRQFRDIYIYYRFIRSRELPLDLYNSPKWRPEAGGNTNIPRLVLGRKAKAAKG